MDRIIKNAAIDWDRVRKELFKSERISRPADAAVKRAVMESAEKALDMAHGMARPAAVASDRRIVRSGDTSLEVDGGIILNSPRLAAYLKHASGIFAFASTVGDGIENAATEYMNNGDPLLGYMLDRTGSFAVESLAENAEDIVRAGIKPEGLGLSVRISPGYCDWPVEEQLKLAKILDLKSIGVVLNEHCMMSPKKSISAIAGYGSLKQFPGKVAQCSICDMKKCGYRRS